MAEEQNKIQYEPLWTVYGKRADFYGIAERFGIDPVIARVLRNRDVIGDEAIDAYLNGGLSDLHDPSLMKDMEKGCGILLEKIKEKKHIRIISDYDVDGVSSNYVLYIGLAHVWQRVHGEAPGGQLSYDIPHRIRDGYGMNPRMVEQAKEDGVDTILTCDNGIAAFPAVTLAKEYGMTVVVTDHHDVPYELADDGSRRYLLPEADAVIDHKQADCAYPCKELCGAGITYKMIQLLYRMCGIPETEMEEYLEIVGIATVCDVMNLVDENRIFVREALKRLQNTSHPGLHALIENSGRGGKKLSTYDLGFIIGPCINAAGRLGDARTSLEFLLETDSYLANERAIELLIINNERKSMTEQGASLAIRLLEEQEAIPDGGSPVSAEALSAAISATGCATLADRVLALYIPGLHESLVGIIAGRLKERYYRPVLLFTDSEEAGIIKGSGRSIEGYHMYDELNRCRELFTKFGGHEMAAGFSMKKDDLKDLRKRLNANCTLDAQTMTPKIRIDVPMPLSYASIALTEQLSRLEPFGKGNEKPLFAESRVAVRAARILGKRQNLLRVTFALDEGGTIDGINFDPEAFISCIKQWFGEDECDRILKGAPNHVLLDVAYVPDINEYGGRKTLQVRILAYRQHIDRR